MSVKMLLPRRRPGVSMAMNGLPSSSKRTSTLSRVVPGTSLTIIRSAWASVLTNVLLPTLRRPTMASFITPSRRRRAGRSSAGSSSTAVQQRVPAAILRGAGAHHLAAELVEFVGLAVQPGVVGLVGHADDRRST